MSSRRIKPYHPMRVVRYNKCVGKDGSVSGTIEVEAAHRITFLTVRYQYRPESGARWSQWGAPAEVLAFTQPLVDRLCRERHDDGLP